jgi:hypothetical protein
VARGAPLEGGSLGGAAPRARLREVNALLGTGHCWWRRGERCISRGVPLARAPPRPHARRPTPPPCQLPERARRWSRPSSPLPRAPRGGCCCERLQGARCQSTQGANSSPLAGGAAPARRVGRGQGGGAGGRPARGLFNFIRAMRPPAQPLWPPPPRAASPVCSVSTLVPGVGRVEAGEDGSEGGRRRGRGGQRAPPPQSTAPADRPLLTHSCHAPRPPLARAPSPIARPPRAQALRPTFALVVAAVIPLLGGDAAFGAADLDALVGAQLVIAGMGWEGGRGRGSPGNRTPCRLRHPWWLETGTAQRPRAPPRARTSCRTCPAQSAARREGWGAASGWGSQSGEHAEAAGAE